MNKSADRWCGWIAPARWAWNQENLLRHRRLQRLGLMPISEAIDAPSERLPEPEYIYVTKNEYDRMFSCANVVEQTVNCVEEKG